MHKDSFVSKTFASQLKIKIEKVQKPELQLFELSNLKMKRKLLHKIFPNRKTP